MAKKKQKAKWSLQVGFLHMLETKTHMVSASLIAGENGQWGLVGLTSPLPKKGKRIKSAAEGIDHVLDHHAHQNLGVWESPQEAMKYGMKWVAALVKGKKPPAIPECACTTVTK